MAKSRRGFMGDALVTAGVLSLGRGIAIAAPLAPSPSRTGSIWGLTGVIDDIRVARAAAGPFVPIDKAAGSDGLDLKRMAQWAMNYLTRSPRPELNYEPVFQCHPYACPPIPAGSDPVVACDTDARMDWEWYYMRDIAGSDTGRGVEAAFHRRIRNYIAPDGKVIAHPGGYNEEKINKVYTAADDIYHVWGATKILQSLAEEYVHTGSAESLKQGRLVMRSLRSIASEDASGDVWFDGGMGAWKDGKWVVNAWNRQPAPIVAPLVRFWQATGDTEALRFARQYADGMINNKQPNAIRFEPDGRFGGPVDGQWKVGHSHATMHAVWGVAELGAATGEQRYIAFAKRTWDWMLSRGTGTGWFPAGPDNCNETCCLSDMISIAAALGRAGHPEYYDAVERYLNNYIAPLQFIMTDEFRAFYRDRNKGDDVDSCLATLERMQGGIIGGSGLNDYENVLLGGVSGFEMFGCCAPEGMRAIHTAWSNIIERRAKTAFGPAGIYVNLAMARETPLGDVTTRPGQLAVAAHVGGPFLLRVPSWAPRDQVRAFNNGKPVKVQWSGDYVRFNHVTPGDGLTISYPVLEWEHSVSGLWSERPELTTRFRWRGNRVIDVAPRPARFALFGAEPRTLPLPPA